MQYAPHILDGRVCLYDTVCEGQGNHVEVTHADDEVAALGSCAHEFCNFPCLGCSMADVGIVGFAFIGGVELPESVRVLCIRERNIHVYKTPLQYLSWKDPSVSSHMQRPCQQTNLRDRRQQAVRSMDSAPCCSR